MNTQDISTMRDALIEAIYERMKQDDSIYFLSADCGARALDQIRADCGARFRSVGIAEQNLINVATGLALEGFTVFAYAIAPFLSMRACEQIRTNLSLHSQFKALNINLISIGAGLSYDLSGPTHHCLEDISLIRLLPHIELFSPSDWALTQRYLSCCLQIKGPKYLRLDSKPLPRIYTESIESDLAQGFTELIPGGEIGIVSTGYMTHAALEVARACSQKARTVGVIDLFLPKSFCQEALYARLQKFSHLITLEEGFIQRGGLDAAIADLLIAQCDCRIHLHRRGIEGKHLFEMGGREYLHQLNGIDPASLVRFIEQL